MFKMLRKIRDSFDMTRNMVDKRTRKMLSYTKGRVIILDEDEGSTSSDNVSGTNSDEEEDEENCDRIHHKDLNFH